MHEVSLVESLFDQVDRAIGKHPSASVREITVRIGALAGVEPTLFRTAFDGLRVDRGYEGAALRVEDVTAAWRCSGCGRAIEDGEALECPACEGRVALSSGGEIILARVELEVSDV